MTNPVPTPPEKALRRILTISRLDGWGVVGVAGLSLLLTLVFREWLGVGVSLLVLAAGSMELRGHRDLVRRNPGGINWLVCSQLFLLSVLWLYVWIRLRFFDAEALWKMLPAFSQDQISSQLRAAGLDPVQDRVPLLQMMNLLVCVMLALVTLVYQGGLALYYALKGKLLRQALLA